MEQKNSLLEKGKIGIGGYLWLFLAVVAFSGIFGKYTNGLQVLDYQTWLGAFGKISEDAFSAGIMGKGGSGVNNGFNQVLTIAPGVILGIAFMNCVDHYKGLAAARKLLSPIMKPVMGMNGACGLSFIANLQSSDSSAALCKSAYDSGAITERDRNILAASIFTAAAPIGRFFSNCLILVPFLPCSTGTVLLVILLMKVVAANLMRLYLYLTEDRKAKKSLAQ